jgi:hypothetical protein
MLGIFWLVIKHNHGKGEFSEEEIEVVAGAGIKPVTQGFSVSPDGFFWLT